MGNYISTRRLEIKLKRAEKQNENLSNQIQALDKELEKLREENAFLKKLQDDAEDLSAKSLDAIAEAQKEKDFYREKQKEAAIEKAKILKMAKEKEKEFNSLLSNLEKTKKRLT